MLSILKSLFLHEESTDKKLKDGDKVSFEVQYIKNTLLRFIKDDKIKTDLKNLILAIIEANATCFATINSINELTGFSEVALENILIINADRKPDYSVFFSDIRGYRQSLNYMQLAVILEEKNSNVVKLQKDYVIHTEYLKFVKSGTNLGTTNSEYLTEDDWYNIAEIVERECGIHSGLCKRITKHIDKHLK